MPKKKSQKKVTKKTENDAVGLSRKTQFSDDGQDDDIDKFLDDAIQSNNKEAEKMKNEQALQEMKEWVSQLSTYNSTLGSKLTYW